MLISFKYRFIFVANTKCASTSIEEYLQHSSDIAIRQQKKGKHWPADRIARKYQHILMEQSLSISDFFRFGVVRDPVEWIVSWFNYRSRSELSEHSEKSTHSISFNGFVNVLCSERETPAYAQFSTQARRFMSLDGKLSVSYLVPYPRISEDMDVIVRELRIPVKRSLKKIVRNVSPERMTVDEVSKSQRRRIEKAFERDKEIYELALNSDPGQLRLMLKDHRESIQYT